MSPDRAEMYFDEDLPLRKYEEDLALRNEAGLAEAGMDDEDNCLWLGTDKAWRKYEELIK